MKTNHHPNQTADAAELASELRADPTDLRRTLTAAGLHPIAGRYDRSTAVFVWLARQAKNSPTRTATTNIRTTSPAIKNL